MKKVSTLQQVCSNKIHEIFFNLTTTVLDFYKFFFTSISEFIDEKNLRHLNDNWDSVAPYVLDYNYTIPKDKHKEVANKIKKHYFGKKAIDKSTRDIVVQMVGDRLFVADGEKAARLMAKSNKNQVKFYYYSYRAAQSLSEALSGTKEDYGLRNLNLINQKINCKSKLVFEQNIFNLLTFNY